MFAISGHRDLPVRPLACQVNADTGNDCGLVLQTEGGEVEAAWKVDGQKRRQTFISQVDTNALLHI